LRDRGAASDSEYLKIHLRPCSLCSARFASIAAEDIFEVGSQWTVPGGKLVRSEYENLPKRPYVLGQKPSDAPQWYGMMDWLLQKEVREEVGLEIGKVEYLTDLVFIRPDGFPVVTLSFWCMYKSGDVKLCKDLTDHTWVTVEEAKNYDLIEGIWDELVEVERALRTT
jgi:8-oxo-dGTP pyrophosphatase MutT (NUDIX family)